MAIARVAGLLALALLAAGGYALWRDPAEQYALACLIGLLVGAAVFLLIPERRG